MTLKNIVIFLVIAAIVIAIVMYIRKGKSSTSNNANPSSTDGTIVTTNNVKAMRLPTDAPEVTTQVQTPVFSDKITGYDANGNIITDNTIPSTTQEIATPTGMTLILGAKLIPMGIAFLMGQDGLTHKYYQITENDYVLADNVRASTNGVVSH